MVTWDDCVTNQPVSFGMKLKYCGFVSRHQDQLRKWFLRKLEDADHLTPSVGSTLTLLPSLQSELLPVSITEPTVKTTAIPPACTGAADAPQCPTTVHEGMIPLPL